MLLRALERGRPELLLSAVSAVATLFGLSWALSPVLAGVAATETHDLGRLVHYPVRLPVLVLSSLLANVLQPIVLAQLPPLGAAALALAGPGLAAALAFAGLLLSLALALAAGQVVGLGLHAVARRRRWHDRVTLAGVGLGMLLSLLPLLVLAGGGGAARPLVAPVLERDLFALVPFSWGVRAAVHAGRGEALAFVAWTAAALGALAGALAVSTAIASRLYRGELDLGESRTSAARPAAMRLPGAVGALVEKDLRVTWRDPRLKALVLSSVVGPTVILLFIWQGSGGEVAPEVMLALASFSGLGVLGANVFALERAGLALLFGFPVERFSLLVGKNVGVMLLRLPALALVCLATLLVGAAPFLPAVATVFLLTQLVGCALDNFVSIHFPIPVPGAARDPNTPISGVRGLGAAATAFLAMLASLLVSAPFAFLAWLPHLLERYALWAASLPLALAGAAGVYFILTSAAARVLARREPELVAGAVGEA